MLSSVYIVKFVYIYILKCGYSHSSQYVKTIIYCTCFKCFSSTGLKQSDKFTLTGLNSIRLSIQTSFHTHTLTHNYSALKEDLPFQRHIIAGYGMSHRE